MSDWRSNVARREADQVRNCKRCKHIMPDGQSDAVCLLWSKHDGRLKRIGYSGYSNEKNDAPFCQFFDTDEGGK